MVTKAEDGAPTPGTGASDPPVVDCYEETYWHRGRLCMSWWFWCPYCRKWHEHGASPGHRAPHCMDAHGTPFENGYVLRYAGQWEDRVREAEG
jgi:hypothetical protein